MLALRGSVEAWAPGESFPAVSAGRQASPGSGVPAVNERQCRCDMEQVNRIELAFTREVL